MRALETIACIIAAVFLLFVIPIMMRAEYAGECQEVVAESTVEKLCSHMQAGKMLHLVDVESVVKSLMECGYTGELSITVFTYEEALDGSIHRYSVSWEEILNVIGAGEYYTFPSDCYVRVEVPAYYAKNGFTNMAFGRDGFERTFILGSGI